MNHRRSRSAGADRWLDHRPENVPPLDTLMQPKMKKKKSVGKLEVKDTNKASKYVLTTQNSDSKGNVETQMVKVCTVELRGMRMHYNSHLIILLLTKDS